MYTISFQRTFCEVLDRFETATDLSKVSELYHDTEYLLYMIVKIAKKNSLNSQLNPYSGFYEEMICQCFEQTYAKLDREVLSKDFVRLHTHHNPNLEKQKFAG